MATNNSTITSSLFDAVSKSLSNKDMKQTYKNDIDRYIANNTDKYFIIGPGERPIFSDDRKNEYLRVCGLSRDMVKTTLKNSKHVGSDWKIMNEPFNTANALATRHFAVKKDAEFIKLSQWYLIISMYPSIHYKYFKHGVNEACMQYTINNLSEKYKIRQVKNLWIALTESIQTAYTLHEKNIIKGEDVAFVKYIQDVKTRINSLIKNIAQKYYENYEKQNFLETEYENFDDESYKEAESNSYEIDRITNNVVNHLVIHGPDMKLVELAAKSCQVSINDLRTYTINLINSKHRQDINDIVEAILFLFLFNDDGEHHSVDQIRTNEFMIYCLKIYKRSNTTNKNVIKIKAILDKWVDEVGVKENTGREATVLNYKKSFYTFFVLSIEKYGK